MARGVDFVITIGSDVLGGQRGATLNRGVDTMDATAKASAGEWKENEIGFKSWGIDADGLVVESDAAFVALEAAFAAGTKVTVTLTTPANNTYTGTAIITDFPIDAPYDDMATYSISLLGDGALA